MSQTETKTLLLLKPRGFCAGVVRAIDIVRIALETFGAPIYVRKEIVHNRYVVDELTLQGRHFCRQRRGSSGRRARHLQRARCCARSSPSTASCASCA